MLVLQCEIEIIHDGKTVRFDYCTGITIQTSCRNLTDTAELRVPRKMRWNGKPITDFVRRNDEITMRFGYEGHGLQTVFKGYVSSVENGTPVIIRCENLMRLFKQVEVAAEVMENFDIAAFIGRYAPGVRVEAPDRIGWGKVTVTEGTLAGFLDELGNTFPWFHGFFKGDTFHAITSYQALGKEVALDPERNQISDTLKYIHGEDEKIAVKAVRILPDNSKIEAIVPEKAVERSTDKSGKVTERVKSGYNQRQVYCTNTENREELLQEAQRRLKEFSSDRMEGTVTTFGIPFVEKGDVVRLRDRIRKERDGRRFFVDGVKYTFGNGGYRQVITLGARL